MKKSEEVPNPLDVQIGGNHYKKPGGIQPFEYTFANKLGGFEHTVVKYVTRWRDKGGIQDLEKAIHTLEMLIELEKKRLEEESKNRPKVVLNPGAQPSDSDADLSKKTLESALVLSLGALSKEQAQETINSFEKSFNVARDDGSPFPNRGEPFGGNL